MKNYVQKGDTLKFVAGADISSGDMVEVGDLVGVAIADCLNGEECIAYIEGVYELPKVNGDVIGQGDIVYHDGSGAITSTVGSNKVAGYAFEAKGAGTDSIQVKLDR